MRILIADDSARIRERIRTFLIARPDVEVCGEASDGEEAVEKARGSRPDVIVLDFSMPRMNGLDAGGKIRKEISAEVLLILFTMHKNPELDRQARAAGFQAVVPKSDGMDLLFEQIEKLTGAAEQERRKKAAEAGK